MEGVQNFDRLRNLPIAGHFIERWGKNLKMCDGKALNLRILNLLPKTDFLIPKILLSRGSQTFRNILKNGEKSY